MADVVLKNASGSPVTYTGVEKVVLPTADGGTVEFTAGEGPAVIPDYVIRTGDTLKELYFNRYFDLSPVITEGLDSFPLLVTKISDTRDFHIIYERTKDDSGTVTEFKIIAHLKQAVEDAAGTARVEEADLVLYQKTLGGWLLAYLDLDGFDIGPVTAAFDYDGTLPLYAKAAVPEFNSLGGGTNGIGLQQGDIVDKVYFNTYEIPDAAGPGINISALLALIFIGIGGGSSTPLFAMNKFITANYTEMHAIVDVGFGLNGYYFFNNENRTEIFFIADS